MTIQSLVALRGPNRWAPEPLLVGRVAVPALAGREVGAVPGLRRRLLDGLPDPILADPAREDVAARLERLRAGAGPAWRLPEDLARVLLGLTGARATFAATEPTGPEGGLRVLLGYDDEEVDRECVATAWGLLRRALAGEAPDVPAEVARLKALANAKRLGPSTLAIVLAARARGIPARRLTAGSLVQLGWGARQRRIWTAQTDRTGAIGAEIASDKELTQRLLRAAGVPVPAGRVVASEEDAWAAAREIGPPVVVKPRNANHAQGVSLGLTTPEAVGAAFRIAANVYPGETTDVRVERYIPGAEHRVLVVDGRAVAAYRGEPARVVGDGERSVAALTATLNRDPRRGPDWRCQLDLVALDAVAHLVLAEQGYTPESVPPAGAEVVLQRTADRCLDVTDRLHPEVAARVVEAARVVGLDVAGIDLVADDVGRPLESQGGAIIEVNSGPGLMGHLQPAEGRPRPVGEAIVAGLFPDKEDDGRIPVVAVVAARDATALARRLARGLAGTGRGVGLACADGTFLGARRLPDAPAILDAAARELLGNRLVDVAVVEVGPDDADRRGLAFDRCGVAVVGDLGTSEDDEDEIGATARLVIECVAADGGVVLATADPRAADLVARCARRVLRVVPDPEPVSAGTRREAGPRPAGPGADLGSGTEDPLARAVRRALGLAAEARE
jgi:cyanophycin synthetase